MFNRNRAEKDERAGQFIRFLFRPRVSLIVLYVGICLAFGMIRDVSKLITTDDVIKFIFALVAMLAMLHYYLDGFIWKIRDQATRQSLGVTAALQKENSQRLATEWSALPAGLRHAFLGGSVGSRGCRSEYAIVRGT